MDIGRAFVYMFDDDQWVKKLAIGGLLVLASIIPIVNLFTGLVVTGYTVRIIRNVAEGRSLPLPEWDDWGGDWMRGLLVVVAAFLYSLPILFASGFGAILDTLTRNTEAMQVAQVCFGLISCLSSIWGLVVAVVLPAATIRFAMEEEFASFFRFRNIFRLIGDNLGNYVIAVLLGIVAQIIAAFGLILCVVGVFFTGFWASLVSSHLYGQVAAEGGIRPTSPPSTGGFVGTYESPEQL
ncbi:MAG TPA: DUF4013 domain-containing protein [Chloroflexi bacterium]|jgi:uncharacterized protein involved in cysteine biosynthesis|nr:DUF4013 domain-containing protein [Chloroflexota bacterium]